MIRPSKNRDPGRCATPHRGAMKRWTEAKEVLASAVRWNAEGHALALATLVSVSGSAYRSPGARLLVASNGSTCGNVSGGCLEEDLREVALRVIGSGVAEMRTYCTGAGEEEAAWDLGVGCEGVIEVYVTPLHANELFSAAKRLLEEGREPFVGVTPIGEAQGGTPCSMILTASGREVRDPDAPVLGAEARAAAHEALESGVPSLVKLGGRTLFLDVLIPPPRLLIVGAGDDARPLAEFACRLGFRVTVADRRPGKLAAERFPSEVQTLCAPSSDLPLHLDLDEQSRAVVMTHNYAEDLTALRSLLGTRAGYIGVLGPRRRTERLLSALISERPEEAGRVHGPVGLNIGGEGAEAVALSILAEILTLPSDRTEEGTGIRLSTPHVAAD